MAEDSFRTGGEHRRHPASLPWDNPVAYGIDALLDQVQPADLKPVLNRILTHPQLKELSAAHHPVLPFRQPHDRLLRSLFASPPGTAI